MPPRSMKEQAMPARFAEILKSEIPFRRPTQPSPTTPAVRRPTLWAASSWWEPYAPCPLQVQAYDRDSTTFGNSNQSITLLKNGDQFLMMADVSLGLYDPTIRQVDRTHNPSRWGGLQQSGIYVESSMGRYIVNANSPLENSYPPEKILSFTTYFEAWQDNEELELHANADFGYPHDHPVKLWAKLIRLQIVKL